MDSSNPVKVNKRGGYRKFGVISLVLIIVVLISTQIWLFYRVYELELLSTEQQAKINILQSELSENRSDFVYLSNELDNMRSYVNILDGDLPIVRANVSTLASGLDYVTSISENTNRWAHSH